MNNELLAPSVIDYFNKWNFEVKEVEELKSKKIMITTNYMNGESNPKVQFIYFPETGSLQRFKLGKGELIEANYYINYLPKRIELLFEKMGKKVIHQHLNGDEVVIGLAGDKLRDYRYNTKSKDIHHITGRFQNKEQERLEYANVWNWKVYEEIPRDRIENFGVLSTEYHPSY